MTAERYEQPLTFKQKRMYVFLAIQERDLTLLEASLKQLGTAIEKALAKPNKAGLTPLLYSLQTEFYEGFRRIAKSLPEDSKVFGIPDRRGNNYISCLAQKGELAELQNVFSPHHRSLLLTQNEYGRTPLLEACHFAPMKKNKVTPMIQFLLEQGSSVHHSGFTNHTALRTLIDRTRGKSAAPEDLQAFISLSRHGALLCQRLPEIQALVTLEQQPELLTYGASFGGKPAASYLPKSQHTLSALEELIEQLKAAVHHTTGPEKIALESQLKNIGYALEIFTLPPSSKRFGQTFFEPNGRPLIPALSGLPDLTTLPPATDSAIGKAQALHNMTLFWLFQCYKEFTAPHPVTQFIQRNTAWAMLVLGVAWAGTFIAMLIDNAVRRFNIPGYRDGIELAPAVQDAVKEANNETIPFFIGIGAIMAGALLLGLTSFLINQSEKNKERSLLNAYPNLPDIKTLIQQLQSFIPELERKFKRLEHKGSLEELESFTSNTSAALMQISDEADTSEFRIKI
jgi:hypothetical protein